MKTLPVRYLWAVVAVVSGLALALSLRGLADAQAPAASPVQALNQSCDDSYEPDNVYTQARPITPNAIAQTHTFSPSNDYDWVALPMTAGQVYRIYTSNLISPTDTYLELYDTNGAAPPLDWNDDIDPANKNWASQIITMAARTGTFYVKVREYRGQGGCGYGYDLAVDSTTVYLPLVAAPSNLAISSLEVTQSVQKPDNSVPLVANRRTVVRAYAYSLTGAPVGNVHVSLAGSSNGVALPELLVTPAQTAPAAPSRASYPGFSIELPGSWLSNTVVITANAYVGDTPYQGAKSSLTLNFNVVPTLDVMVVPITYTHTPSPNNWTYAAPAANITTTNEIRDWFMRAYPVSQVAISFHTPVAFTGNLGLFSNWSSLLNSITSLKASEGGPGGRVYYGLIPTTDGAHRWFYGGYSGLGWVGWMRASIGLQLPASTWGADATGQNAAHEIGHNLGQGHAPCGGVTDPDPDYPYSGAIIGQYGLDIPKGVLWSSTTTYDLMSYCDPQWVSDYTYQGLYTDQRANGAAALAAPAPGLFIRATFDEAGEVTLKPVYALSLPATGSPAESDYQVELVDGKGQVLAAYPAPVLEATADPGGEVVRGIHAVVPQPDQPAARVRLVRGGQTVAEKAVAGEGLGIQSIPTVSGEPGGPITLRWDAVDKPALVRYSADAGQTWITLGVDVLGGELTLDSAALPEGGAGQFEVTLADP